MKKYLSYNNHILLNLLAESDEAAFTEIYNRYWKKLYAIAYNRLKETGLAEDIVHDVFAGLWANRQKLNIDSLENYLATACKYMVLGKIKKKARERTYIHSTYQTPVAETFIENAVHYKRILEIVKTEIERLPEKCRLIFYYSRNDGKPVKQIAEELSLSQKTVENQLNKALKIIKTAARPLISVLLLLHNF